jgi:hypothetical protein
MAGRPRSSTGQNAIARAWGMTQAAVNKWAKLGCPMDDIDKATKWREDYLAANGQGQNAPASLNDARLQKLVLESERLRLKIAQDRGELVEVSAVKESGIRIGAIFSAKLAALVNDASGALAGLGEAELRKKLHERTQQILSEIRDELEKL